MKRGTGLHLQLGRKATLAPWLFIWRGWHAVIQFLFPGLSNYRLDHQPDLSHSGWTEESAATLIELDNKNRTTGVGRRTDRVRGEKKRVKKGGTTRPSGNCAFLSFGEVMKWPMLLWSFFSFSSYFVFFCLSHTSLLLLSLFRVFHLFNWLSLLPLHILSSLSPLSFYSGLSCSAFLWDVFSYHSPHLAKYDPRTRAG